MMSRKFKDVLACRQCTHTLLTRNVVHVSMIVAFPAVGTSVRRRISERFSHTRFDISSNNANFAIRVKLRGGVS